MKGENKLVARIFWILLIWSQNIFSATFSMNALPPASKRALINAHFFHEKCPVPLERLSQVTVTYYDFQGKVRTGNIVVLDSLAPFLLGAFQNLYKRHFPIESTNIGGESSDGMLTIGFNCRKITGGAQYSLHSYGVAVDINMLRNPYIGVYSLGHSEMMNGALIPSTAASFSYLNRSWRRPGMNEEIISIMKKNGFIEWGGEWIDRVDYQHFQVPKNIAENLLYLDKDSGEKLVTLIIRFPKSAQFLSTDVKWKYLYELYPDQFMNVFQIYFSLLGKREEQEVFNLVKEKLVRMK